MLDPRRLQLLLSLKTLGTMRAVAAAESMSTSAVSQQLAVLESECGVELLERYGRTVTLTAAGGALAARAVDILDQIAAAEEEVHGWKQGATGVVRVGAFTSALAAFAIDAARTVGDTHPGLQVALSELEPHRTVPALARGEIDIAIVGDYEDASEARKSTVEETVLVIDELLAVLPAGHGRGRRQVRLEELSQEDWLVDGTDLERYLTSRCRRAGFEMKVSGRLSSHDSLARGVEVGLGVTILPGLAVDRSRGLEPLPLEPRSHRTVRALVRPKAAPRPSIVATLKAIVAASRDRDHGLSPQGFGPASVAA